MAPPESTQIASAHDPNLHGLGMRERVNKTEDATGAPSNATVPVVKAPSTGLLE